MQDKSCWYIFPSVKHAVVEPGGVPIGLQEPPFFSKFNLPSQTETQLSALSDNHGTKYNYYL